VRRRDFIAGLGGAAAAWPLAARAQQPERMRRVGVIIAVSESDPQARARTAAFRQALQDLGWVDGRNIEIDYRFPGADLQRIRESAKEMIGLGPDVILANTTPVVAALQRENTSIPIVFNQVSDPIKSGFIASLEQPGGTITGFTNIFDPSMGRKWLELLKEIAPRIKRAALIYNPNTTPANLLRSAQAAAPSLGVQMTEILLRDAAELQKLVATFAEQPDGALLVQPDVTTTANRGLIMSAAARHGLPAIYPYNYYPAEGGLMSYGIDTIDQYRAVASYVDRILKGAKPADLPVQVPTKYQLAINLKTAKALGLDVPPMLLDRADEVIK
jgi:putative ABC transport system substrate-binding protein